MHSTLFATDTQHKSYQTLKAVSDPGWWVEYFAAIGERSTQHQLEVLTLLLSQ
jgi:hypothetical protein